MAEGIGNNKGDAKTGRVEVLLKKCEVFVVKREIGEAPDLLDIYIRGCDRSVFIIRSIG